MIMRKTASEFKRRIKDFEERDDNRSHMVKIIKYTYWFLSIPIYSTEQIISTNL